MLRLTGEGLYSAFINHHHQGYCPLSEPVLCSYLSCGLKVCNFIHNMQSYIQRYTGCFTACGLRNRPKSDTYLYELFWSQRPRKSPPAV